MANSRGPWGDTENYTGAKFRINTSLIVRTSIRRIETILNASYLLPENMHFNTWNQFKLRDVTARGWFLKVLMIKSTEYVWGGLRRGLKESSESQEGSSPYWVSENPYFGLCPFAAQRNSGSLESLISASPLYPTKNDSRQLECPRQQWAAFGLPLKLEVGAWRAPELLVIHNTWYLIDNIW